MSEPQTQKQDQTPSLHTALFGNRVVQTILAVVVAGFLIVNLANFWFSTTSIRQAIVESDLPLSSDTLYSETQRDLLKPVFVSSLMAHDTFVRDWVLGGEHDTTRMTRYLAEIKERYGAFTSFFVSARTGVYYQAKGILKTVSPDEPRDKWFYRVQDMATPYEINVDADMANDDTITIFINYKVFDYDGNFLGATGIGLRADSVKRLIEFYEQSYQRTVYFVEPDGAIALHGKRFDASETNINKREGISAIAAQILGQPKGRFEYMRDGHTIFLNSRFIPELGWYLLVEQDGDISFAKAEKTLVINLLVGLCVAVLVSLLAAYLVRNSQRKLQVLASTDALTGVLGRLPFDAVFNHAKQRAVRNSTPLALVFFDIDYFKSINDKYGHHMGDRVLVHVCDCIRASIRASDSLCRWGGEEMLVLLEDCSLQEAYTVAEKARQVVSSHVFTMDNGDTVTVTMSAGVAVYQQGEAVDALIARADQAMYQAKNRGRNCTVVSEQ